MKSTRSSGRSPLRMFLIVLSIVAASNAGAELPKDQQALVKLEDLTGRLDLAIPQSPAFTLLGVAPEKIVQSDDLRTVATSLLKGLDANGNLQEGVALDVRPYLLVFGDHSTLRDYRDSAFVRFASRTQLSFATASGSSSSDRADRQALGLNLKLWVQHDPAMGSSQLEYTAVSGDKTRGSLDACYEDYLRAASPGAPDMLPTDDEIPAAEEKIAAKARLATTKCLAPFKQQHWNGGSVELAIAGHRSKVGLVDESGFGAWLGASYGIGDKTQIVGRASYAENILKPVKGQANQYQVVDESDAGLRLRTGSSRGALLIEGLWTRTHGASLDEKYWRASIGTELMIMPDIWIQLAVGKAFSTDKFDSDPVYSGQLRFGFSEKSLFAKK